MGNPIIQVLVSGKGNGLVPSMIGGFPVKILVTGKLSAKLTTLDRWPRPVPFGISTGHPDITAGTLGARVKNATNVFALSNNHVYANQNNAIIGDSIIQPGAFDGGMVPVDIIGTLSSFVPIKFDGSDNTLDAAITLSSTANLNVATPQGLKGYGTPKSTIVSAFLGGQRAVA